MPGSGPRPALQKSPTTALLFGLVITLGAVLAFAAYMTVQLSGLRRLQSDLVERNRRDSLQLLRIQNDLNSLSLAMRDMLDAQEPYPLTAWTAQFDRIREDLDAGFRLEEQLAASSRTQEQRRFLSQSLAQFWDAVDRMFAHAGSGREAEARDQIRLSLQSRAQALSTAVSRLLVENNEGEQQAAAKIAQIYDGVQHQLYFFLSATLVAIVLTSLYLIRSNRLIFAMSSNALVDRRAFLKTATAGGAVLLIGCHLPGNGAPAAGSQEKPGVNPFNAWVRITPDNQITLILGKSEMGQGVSTALPMILAEELCVEWDQVKVEQAPTNPKIYAHGTGGSGSVAGSYLPLRQAGAAAREMMITAAAKHWNVVRETCKAEKGGILHGARKNFLTYGELVAEASKLPVPNLNKVPLKNPNDFTIIGHDTRRLEARDKATGAAKYGIDSRVPGMLYAVVARCPVFGGKVKTFDATRAKAVPGVREVLTIDGTSETPFTAGGVAVVAENSWAAMQGRKALDIAWEEGPAATESSDSLRAQFLANAAKPGKVVRNDGDADAA